MLTCQHGSTNQKVGAGRAAARRGGDNLVCS